MGLLDILAQQNRRGLLGNIFGRPTENIDTTPLGGTGTKGTLKRLTADTNNPQGFADALQEKYPKAVTYIGSLWSDLQRVPQRLYTSQEQQQQAWRGKTWVENNRLVQVDENTLAPTLTNGNTTAYSGDIKQHKIVQVLRGEIPVPAGAERPVKEYLEGQVNNLKALQSAGTGNWLEILPLLGALPGGVIDPAQIIQLAIMQAEKEKKGEIWEQWLRPWYESFNALDCDSANESDRAICNLMKTTIRNFVGNLLMQTWMPKRPTTGGTLGTRSAGVGGLGDAFSTLITLMMFKDLFGRR